MLGEANRIVICSGWLKTAGVQLLLPELEAAVARNVNVTVYSNKPPRKTEDETEEGAILALQKLGIEHIIVERQFYLHAKICYVETGQRFHRVIGSANITIGGLRKNEELPFCCPGRSLTISI
ncbi:PLD-like domain-containing protein [Paraburkholderia steynii]|uniref:PLD-like domain-containing protein n=1 Tax=Paraburkholderia steynii TaxID=1245441 RepID=A0A7Z7BDX2_9BURK|nr:PLD-like domain-containing protein [Paraburkholderia steynii]